MHAAAVQIVVYNQIKAQPLAVAHDAHMVQAYSWQDECVPPWHKDSAMIDKISNLAHAESNKHGKLCFTAGRVMAWH
jgi:hypothetical protein